MENLKMHTPDLADENFKKLAALFPNAVTETKDENGNVVRAIDADVLRQEISATVVEGPQERYQFTWPDKKKSVVLANQPIAKTLRLDREKSVGKDGTAGNIDTENIYIEGDNLDALKLLQETYLGKIKMIYIDPPYNTGNDFIYEDDFTQSTDDYLENSGQFDEEGNRLVQNTESNGRFHTDWLNMLYPRLRLAKDLLTDDGVIFISIDDNEYSHLKDICDEIFGSQSYLATFVWKRRASSQMDRSKCSADHEYILSYKGKEFNALRGTDKDFKGYSNPDNDPRGPWTTGDLTVGMTGDMRPNQYYDLIDPKTGKIYKPNYNRVWSYIPASMNQLIAENRIVFPEDTSKRPMKKRFASELDSGTNPESTWLDKVGMNTEGTKQMYELFGKAFFSYTKPVSLVKELILQTANKNDIVLDFFSGSATTTHAVMQLNAEDSGHRKFIMVQLPEQTDAKSEAYKAGYKTICDIGEERIRRAGKKIKEESPLTTTDLDIGFRVFKVDSTNMEDVYYRPADYNQGQMELFADNIKSDRTPEDLLFQVMLDLGILLSSDIQETEIAGKKVFSVADGYLIACFDKNVTEETVKAIAQKQPVYAVFRDSSMASDSVATNFEQIFETYSPRTQRKVL
ncbi:MAG: site-specific DNA-methyltransferase [Ruminococcus sp.]|nr:site-specific DNA-methyltransferase [Ruminococcus sp.]